MSLYRGSLTARRFKIVEPVTLTNAQIRKGLEDFSFHEPVVDPGLEVVEGWVRHDSLLETDFSKEETWYAEPWVFFALRIDKKNMPGAILRAEMRKAVEAWKKATGKPSCPHEARAELRDQIMTAYLAKTRAKTKLIEVAWNTTTGMVLLDKLGDNPIESVRKRMFRSFGVRTRPWSALDLLKDPKRGEELVYASACTFTP